MLIKSNFCLRSNHKTAAKLVIFFLLTKHLARKSTTDARFEQEMNLWGRQYVFIYFLFCCFQNWPTFLVKVHLAEENFGLSVTGFLISM